MYDYEVVFCNLNLFYIQYIVRSLHTLVTTKITHSHFILALEPTLDSQLAQHLNSFRFRLWHFAHDVLHSFSQKKSEVQANVFFSETITINRPYTTFYWSAIVSIALSCRQCETLVENRNFFIPRAFDAPVRGFPSKYYHVCHAVWYEKTRMMWLPDSEKVRHV